MKSKLTKNESVAINKFAVTFAQVRKIKSELTELQKDLAKQGEQVKQILDAKGERLPTTPNQNHHIVLSTTDSQVAWSQLFTERFSVSDKPKLKALLKTKYPECFRIGVSNTVKATTRKGIQE
jgi:hypothetical protein